MNNQMQEIFSYCKNLHLLYIEDNEQARIFTLELLSRIFDNITVAEDGEEGIKKFKDEKIDLIISDVNMPKMCGIKMSEKIRDINKEIPIFLLSAHNELNFKKAAYNSMVNEYLAKPLNLTQLLEALRKLAALNTLHSDKDNCDE